MYIIITVSKQFNYIIVINDILISIVFVIYKNNNKYMYKINK